MALQCNLKYILLDQKINQTQLAQVTGISRTTISLVANNRVKPDIEIAITIAETLGVPVESIWVLVKEEE